MYSRKSTFPFASVDGAVIVVADDYDGGNDAYVYVYISLHKWVIVNFKRRR